MELKDYQRAALDAFVRWREVLEEKARKAQEMRASLEKDGIAPPSELLDYPRAAWKCLAAAGGVAAAAGDYVARSDAAGRPIPHICLKVPTGGGKTLLAAAALERLNRASGLVLWIVPTRAIYRQTDAALRDRQHPCRQMLERASGGRVKLLEKDSLFTRADIAHYLCVMLLMLPAANRQKGRDFLRMFRDSGRYPDLFPDSDDLAGDRRLLQRHPDLERVSKSGPVKHSLFNAFKLLRPVVVLDEAHKAYGHKREAGEEFARAVSRLDPRLTIELSATPNRGISNLLVDIGGVELKAEEMIKLPVEVTSFTRTEWQHTLAQAHDELERLAGEARALQADKGRYIRPIAVVRVERTGKDQRDGERVHAEDVRDHLILNLGVPSRAIAVKSAERDELAGVDLLSPFSPIRWVVTRAALMEGWDCPFAYLLVMLDNTTARRAVTQLVGRVMRQPHARRTGRPALDRCYVYCWNTDVGAAVEYVKQGLENEGLTGLGDDVFSASQGARKVAVHRRQGWRRRDIFLPLVLHRDGAGWCELDYSRHILPHVDWNAIDAPDPERSLAQAAAMQTASVDLGDAPVTVHESQDVEIDKTVRVSWFARRLADILPNPWQASRIAERLIGELRREGKSDDGIHDRRSWLAHALRRHVADAMDCQAKQVFADKLCRKEIRFDLQTGQPNFRMAKCYEIAVPEKPRHFLHEHGKPMQLSLFEPIYEHHFDSELERRFARYLDERKALLWWHRVASRQGGGYYLKGWRRDRIWPDFVAMGAGTASRSSFFVFETKGRHLDNPDTDYKRRVLEALEGAFNCGTMTVMDGPAKGSFHLLFDEKEFPKALAALGEGG